ncbi:MAG: hypothetical protein ABUS47_04440 [Steroidobacter sp.]|jgi:hypothetical protein
MQQNRENFFLLLRKLIALAYSLLGILILAWTSNRSISLLESTGIGLYVFGAIVLNRFLSFYRMHQYYPSLQQLFPHSKFDKAKILKGLLKIFACFAAIFVVLIVGTIADPKTQAGYIMFFDAPIIIILVVLVLVVSK